MEAEQKYPECKAAIELLSELFGIDRDTPNPNAFESEEKQNRTPPILAKLRQSAIEQRGLPNSGKRKAIETICARWDALQVFIDDPNAPIRTVQRLQPGGERVHTVDLSLEPADDWP